MMRGPARPDSRVRRHWICRSQIASAKPSRRRFEDFRQLDVLERTMNQEAGERLPAIRPEAVSTPAFSTRAF